MHKTYAPIYSERSVYSLQRQVVCGSHAQYYTISVCCNPDVMICRSGLFQCFIRHSIVSINMLKILAVTSSVISLIILAILLNITTPVTAGPFGILMVFISAYILLVVITAYFLRLSSLLIVRISKVFMSRVPVQPVSIRVAYFYSTVLSAVPIMLIGLQSVGSVGIYETILLSLFVLVGCLYVSKRI